MFRLMIAAFLSVALVCQAQAWNSKGHMVVARLAWKDLTPTERAKVHEMLKTHPHYQEFLKAHTPANIPEDEWVFMQAATWADWIKSGPPARRAFSMPTAHYINLPFVFPEGSATPPKEVEVNVISKLETSKAKVKNATNREERAVELTFVFHLVGDIHQPLHCITLFNDHFPQGDRGGTRAVIKIDGHQVNLHSFWDGLLGKTTSLSSIGSTVLEIQQLVQQQPGDVANQLTANTTFKSWAQETFEAGKKYAYLDGALKVLPDEDHHAGAVQNAPESYAENAGDVARYQAYKGGKRLAALLRELIAE